MWSDVDPATPNTRSIAAFGPFRLSLGDPIRLWKGCCEVQLQPRPLRVLRHLVARAPEIVPKGELLDAVWGGLFVQEEVIKGCVRQIRRALGDDAKRPRYLATRHRVGYAFVTPWRRLPAERPFTMEVRPSTTEPRLRECEIAELLALFEDLLRRGLLRWDGDRAVLRGHPYIDRPSAGPPPARAVATAVTRMPPPERLSSRSRRAAPSNGAGDR